MLRKAFLPPIYVVCLLFTFRILMGFFFFFAFKPLIHLEFILLYSVRNDSVGKESTCNAEDASSIDPWVEKIPWRRKWQPTPVFLPEKSHGQRSLGGCRPWGYKEPDTTERLSMHLEIV